MSSRAEALDFVERSHQRLDAGRPAWLSRDVFPFESRFVDIDGARMHYVDEGVGPVLLLVHGSPMWSFMYREVILALRDQYRCIAVDLPGLGLSDAPLHPGEAFERNAGWLCGFIQTLDLRDLVLVVHATAGPSALEAAVREPCRVRALVISNTFAWPLVGDRRLAFFVRLVSSGLFSLLNVHLNLLARVTGFLGRRGAPFSHAEIAAIRGPYRRRITRRHLQNLLFGVRIEAPFLARLEQRLGSLNAKPALIAYGRHDNGFAAGFFERWRALLPRHTAVVFSESGHFPLEDQPRQFVEALRGFLAGLPRELD